MMMILVVLSSDYNFRLNWSYSPDPYWDTELQSYIVSGFQRYKVTVQFRNPKSTILSYLCRSKNEYKSLNPNA